MEIKGSEAVFDVNVLGNKTNESYMGTFKVKCLLSPLEEIQADRTYRELLGQNSHLAQEHVRQQAFALAQLEQRVIENPPFWDSAVMGGGHIVDMNVILEVLDKAIEAQEKYTDIKNKELKERQDRLANLIKSKRIEKEPEIEKPKQSDEEPEEEKEIDLE